MSDLASNLFLRELAKRDVEKSRLDRQKQIDARDAEIQAENQQRMLDNVNAAEDQAFNRKLKVAQLESQNAARLGREQPQYDDAPVQEMGRVGYSSGEAAKAEELSKAERAAALKKIEQMQAEKLQTMRDAEAMKRAQLAEKGRDKRSADSDKAAMDRARLHESGVASRRSAASKDELTRAALTKKQVKAEESNETLGALRAIRQAASKGKDANGKTIVDYNDLLGPQGVGKLADYEDRYESSPGSLTPEEQADYKRRAGFRARVELMRAQLYKKYIGAGQTPQEATRLVDAIIQHKMNPQQFEAAMQSIEESARRENGDSESDSDYVTAAPEPATGDDQAKGFYETLKRKSRDIGSQVPWVGPSIKTY